MPNLQINLQVNLLILIISSIWHLVMTSDIIFLSEATGHHNLLPNMLHSHKQVTVAMLTPVHSQKHKQQAGKTQK